MRIMSVALALLAITGCAAPTMQEMRSKGPAASYSSAKAEGEVTKCILFAWQDSSLGGGGMPISVQPGRDGGSTVFAGYREYFADVVPVSGGSKISYYEVSNNWLSRVLQPEVKGCI